MKTFIRRYGGTVLIVLLLILAYEVLTDIGEILDPVIFPGLSRVIPTLFVCLPELLWGLYNSMLKLVPAYALALLVGIGVGLVVGQRKELRKTLAPVFSGFASVPATLLTTYAITIFPSFQSASVFIIFFGCLWPILNGTIAGVSLIEKCYLDSARSLELRGITMVNKVVLPAALPTILNGAKTSLNFSFLLLIAAEMFGASSGLGYFVQYYTDFSKFDRVIAGILFMAFFIIIIMQLFEALKSHLLRWRK